MEINNKGKRKLLTQRQVCSRMNYLYQAANLMAHSNNNTLAAYYGKLCRHVGTKSLIHMSPAVKRTMCKRCSLPLLPGVNTTLMLDAKQIEPNNKKPEVASSKPSTSTRKRRIRRLPKRNKTEKIDDTVGSSVAASDDDKVALHLECKLCSAQRRFQIDTQNECWPERSQAIVQTVTLDRQVAAAAGEEKRQR